MSQHTGWSIGRSIMLELGMVMDRLANPDPLPELPEALATLSEGLSEHWHDELTALLGSGRGTYLLPLVLAWVADALFLEDYTEAVHWCTVGAERFPEVERFKECRIGCYLTTIYIFFGPLRVVALVS